MKYVYALLLCFQFLCVSAQEETYPPIVKTDASWGKEIIPFPIDWAPKLTLEGYEELSFAPHWNDKAHQEFWTLVMAWRVKAEIEIPLYELQFNLNHYFYSLMIPNHWAQEFPEPVLKFESEISETYSNTKGTLKLFDGFHTGQLIDLNIIMEQYFCEEQQEAIVIFRISPKSLDHSIWNELSSIKLDSKWCH